MGRQPNPNNQPPEKLLINVLLADTGAVAQFNEFYFLNKSITYFDMPIAQSFQYVLFDNRGPGTIRIVYNRPGMDLSVSQNGAKTLGSGESLYLDEDIWYVGIYYTDISSVEMILKASNPSSGSF